MFDSIPASEGVRALLLVTVSVTAAAGFVSASVLRAPAGSPERLVRQLRLAQLTGALLVFAAGATLGLAVVQPERAGVALDIVLSLGFVILAGAAGLREPGEALALIALACVAHAVVDVLHRPGVLPSDLAPRWYFVGCAVHDVVLAGLAYLPALRRR